MTGTRTSSSYTASYLQLHSGKKKSQGEKKKKKKTPLFQGLQSMPDVLRGKALGSHNLLWTFLNACLAAASYPANAVQQQPSHPNPVKTKNMRCHAIQGNPYHC